MASKNWRDAIQKLIGNWRGDKWQRLTGLVAFFADVVSQGAAEALQAPWINESSSPNDALPLVGSGRSMPRYPGETDDQYRARLETAWTAWIQAGNEASLLAQLGALGLSSIEFKKPGVGWDWDSALPAWQQGGGGSSYWSRFYLVIKGHPWSPEGTWGDGQLWGDGGVIGLTATPAQIQALKAVVDQWRPAHVTCPWIIIVTNLTGWATSGVPNGHWYDWRQRSADAVYIDGPGEKPVNLIT